MRESGDKKRQMRDLAADGDEILVMACNAVPKIEVDAVLLWDICFAGGGCYCSSPATKSESWASSETFA
jgi:hypothetical protein